MIRKFMKGSFACFSCFMMMMVFAVAVVYAKSEDFNTYYRFTCSTTSRTHEASSTPTATITTSNMIGDPSDELWVELEKKYWYGWASPGDVDSDTQVSSVYGSTFSLKGNGSGTYRLLFGKSSMLLTGVYDTKSNEWYSDLYIKYDH